MSDYEEKLEKANELKNELEKLRAEIAVIGDTKKAKLILEVENGEHPIANVPGQTLHTKPVQVNIGRFDTQLVIEIKNKAHDMFIARAAELEEELEELLK